MHYDNRWASQRAQGRLHLEFQIGEKWIAYAYIRKVGCSAFKRLLGYHPSEQIDVIARRHGYTGRKAYDAALFVWRDPVDRLVSLYKSKIVERRGAKGILRECHRVLGRDPIDFDEFAIGMHDPHCWSQYSHLHRMRYTHAIPLEDLHEEMKRLLGEGRAKFFESPVNASRSLQVQISPKSLEKIRSHYADDFQMINQIKISTLRGGDVQGSSTD